MTRIGPRDLPVASAVAGVAMALYLATLQPDFGGPEDTPKFQFLGYVLGTAHPPGYPLYVLLSHLFVQLPVGTIAYRANLFSAVMAALSCALAYRIGRELGARWWVAAGCAVALATGGSFWRSAVFAEVYSLAAVLVAGSTAFLLAWGVHGGTRRLFAAVATFAAGLGNHLTIVGIAPAAVVYALARNRAAITLRVLVVAVLICAAGVAQYGFILERTRHGATYLESGAESLPELIGVIRADRFAEQRFAFSVFEVLHTHVPTTVRLLATDMMPLGFGCFLIGVGTAVQRRSSAAALVLGSAAGMLAMIVNMSGDLRGFITPVLVLLWPIAGLGVEGVAALARRRAGARVALAATVAMAVALPVFGIAANYRDADQSRQTATAEFLRSTYAHLPDGAAIVAEDYFYDMAHEYFLATQEAGPARGVTKVGYASHQVRAAAATGRRVFAFAGAASILAAEGLWFERTMLAFQPLDLWLRELPRNTVIVGATAFAAVPFDPSIVGHPAARGAGRAAPFEAFVLVVGRNGAEWRRDEHRAVLAADATTLKAPLPRFPAHVEARADGSGAEVTVGGHPIAAVPIGLVIAAFNDDGASPRTFEFRPDDAMHVGSAGAVYELKGETACVRLANNEWQEIGALLATGGAVATVAQLGTTVVEIQLLDAGIEAEARHLLGDGDTTVEQERGSDGLSLVWRFSRTGPRRPLFRLAANGSTRRGRARLAANSPLQGATLCPHRSWRPLAAVGGRDRIGADFEAEAFFGAGWSTVERRAGGAVRHGKTGATLLLPLESGTRYRTRLALTGEGMTTVNVFVEGERAGECPLEGERFCEVVVPATPRLGNVTTMRFVLGGEGTPRGFTFYGAWFEKISAESP